MSRSHPTSRRVYRHRLQVALVLPCLLLIFGSAMPRVSAARLASISNIEFWSRLQQTGTLLDRAIADSVQPSPLIAQIEALWDGVDAVQYPDPGMEQPTAVNLSW